MDRIKYEKSFLNEVGEKIKCNSESADIFYSLSSESYFTHVFPNLVPPPTRRNKPLRGDMGL